ncbi:hypothetical protein [Limnoglobus roseus]|uniref:hypothetical protein n=1 Tax=Limnoglobus roseus TaxID=2598579 RepID=UPI0011EB8FAA|nr:hypothetical protein [Limnoglobus roseus]
MSPVMIRWTLSVTGYLNSAKVNYSQDPSPEVTVPAVTAWGQPIPSSPGSLGQQSLANLVPPSGANRLRPAVVPLKSPQQQVTDVITTDHWVTKALLTPRKLLQFGDYNAASPAEPRLMLSQPPDGEVCDVGGGPLPIACDARSIIGSPSTIVVEFSIQTFTKFEPYSASVADSLVLSNEYQMTHTCDEEYSTIRDVVGRITFRSDAVERLKLSPDSLRSGVFLPIPEGYRRTSIQVVARSDGRTLEYSWRDVQQHTNVVDYGIGIAHIECEITEAMVKDKTFDENFVSTWRSIYDLRTARNFAEQKKDPKDADPGLFLKAFPPAPNGKP